MCMPTLFLRTDGGPARYRKRNSADDRGGGEGQVRVVDVFLLIRKRERAQVERIERI